MMDTYIALITEGTASLAQREDQPTKGGTWGSTELLPRHTQATTELSFTLNDDDSDPDHVRVSIHASHVTNKETDNTYHLNLDAKLDWTDIEQLHAFLTFLINIHDE